MNRISKKLSPELWLLTFLLAAAAMVPLAIVAHLPKAAHFFLGEIGVLLIMYVLIVVCKRRMRSRRQSKPVSNL